MITDSYQREHELAVEELQEYAKMLDPCAVCNHVCSHPGCWEASRKYVRQLIRLVQHGDYDPELIFEAQKAQQLEFEKQRRIKLASKSRQPLATQKVYNLNEQFSVSFDGKSSLQTQGSMVSQISMELDLDQHPTSRAEQQIQTSLAPSREVNRRKSFGSAVSSASSVKSGQMEVTEPKSKTADDQRSDQLSSIFTPPVAASPKEETQILKEIANLPSLPPSPQILSTNKIDPLSGFKNKRTPDTVMIWVAPKRVSEPKYREQIFVMTREGKATVPNKNVTNQMLPPGYEPENKFTLGGSFEREKTIPVTARRSQQNTTRVIPVQEEVINELLSLPKEILSQVLEQVTAIDLLTPAKTNEVIEVIISQLHNARALELSRVADECVVSKPVPIYNHDAKKYHEQVKHVEADPVVGLKLTHRNMNTENASKPGNYSRVPDWIREQAISRSHNFANQSSNKLSKVSFSSLPPLRTDLGGRYNRSKSIRRHYPSLDSPLQRGLIPQSSPKPRSKPSSRLTSAQSKLSQISAALATLPSTPYSQYRNILERKQSALSSGSIGESRGAPKTPDTYISATSNEWPVGDELDYFLSESQTRKQQTPEKSASGKRQEIAMTVIPALGQYPSVPPPSPDVSVRKQTSASVAEAAESKRPLSVESENREINTVSSRAEVETTSKTNQEEQFLSDDSAKHLTLGKESVEKLILTPAPTTLSAISESSIDSVGEIGSAGRQPKDKAVEMVTKTESVVNEISSNLSNENQDKPDETTFVKSQIIDSNASLLGKIDNIAAQEISAASFSQTSSLNKISLADIPDIEDDREPLTMEDTMRRAKVLSARKTVRFDENKN